MTHGVVNPTPLRRNLATGLLLRQNDALRCTQNRQSQPDQRVL